MNGFIFSLMESEFCMSYIRQNRHYDSTYVESKAFVFPLNWSHEKCTPPVPRQLGLFKNRYRLIKVSVVKSIIEVPIGSITTLYQDNCV